MNGYTMIKINRKGVVMSKKVYEAYAVVVGGGAAGSVAAYKDVYKRQA